MDGFSESFLRSMRQAYAAATARLPEADTLSATARILNAYPDLPSAKAGISQDVAPSR